MRSCFQSLDGTQRTRQGEASSSKRRRRQRADVSLKVVAPVDIDCTSADGSESEADALVSAGALSTLSGATADATEKVEGRRRPSRKLLSELVPSASASASGSVVEHPPPPPQPIADAAPRPAQAVRQGPRSKRGTAFGPFAVAEVSLRGAIVGYGATCGRHRNLGEGAGVQCKVQCLFGKVDPLSADECRARVKDWCLKGLDISRGDPCGRQAHLSLRPRYLEISRTEAEMDASVEALVARADAA